MVQVQVNNTVFSFYYNEYVYSIFSVVGLVGSFSVIIFVCVMFLTCLYVVLKSPLVYVCGRVLEVTLSAGVLHSWADIKNK